ncbi:filamentous hemagglutinin N-terminal domain-containing protein, partial [Aquitalea magnusonii]|nr:filamentous hemagglutinin N-terminal domain-containing protein [Aquitalea magnusonii]
MLASSTGAAGLPTGGQITLGSGNITQQGNTMLINQSSAKLASNWQTFSIGAGNTVQFIQPSATSIALNRVLGSDVSVIQGSLKANGQVFLLNPNGVLFTSGAQVNTSGLVATTLSLSDQQFSSGHYNFQGSSQGAVINQGNITTSNGGSVALIAAQVTNDGNITANKGSVILASAQDVTLDMGGAVKLAINKGALDSLVSNGGAIQADGGSVLLTAKAADQLTSSVINNTGVIRAQTLANGEKGQIQLLGDMSTGTLNVGGTLDASAPNGGNGGAIETSAASVNTMSGLQVNASSRSGTAGSWLIDPYDYTIGSAAAATISSTLSGGTSVTVTTQSNNAAYGSAGSASGNGDITVNNAITDTGSADVSLTLQAARNITINSPITASNGKLNITLSAANNAAGTTGGVKLNGNLNSNGGNILVGGAGGSLTSATSNGIGYALNYDANSPAVLLGTNVTLQSGGGNIVINGQTNATTSSYSGTQAGIYVLSGATVNSQGGNIYMSGISTASAKEFGFGVEANSGTTTTFETSSSSGGIVVDARNTQNALGALGLVNNGNQARVQFFAPNVAYFQFSINGSNQTATFTKSPPCNANYPNCGTMVIPGGNQSYTEAQYNVVDQALLPIYIFTGNGTKVYDGSTDASNVAVTALGGPSGFTPSALGTLGFNTSSKNAGSYISLNGSASNPSSYQSDTYAVAYFNQGTYTITPKALTAFQATNKTYDGTTAAAVTSSGLVNGDNVQVVATGGFASANVGNNITVNVTGVSLSGTDAGNYTIPNSTAISTTANITPASLTVTASNASKTYDGLAYSGGNGVSYSGFVNGESSSVLGGSLSYGGTAQSAVNAGSYSLLAQGLSSSN